VALVVVAAIIVAVARADGGPQGYTNPDSAALAPNGTVIALEAAIPADRPGSVSPGSAGRIFLVNPDGTQLRQVVRLTGRMFDERVTWLPNSSGFFFLDHQIKAKTTRVSRYTISAGKLSSVTIRGTVRALALSGDGKTLAGLVEGCAKGGGAESRTCLAIVNARTLVAKLVAVPGEFGAFDTVAFLPDNHTVLTAEPNKLRWYGTWLHSYDVRTGKFHPSYQLRSSATGNGYSDVIGINLSPTHKQILYTLSGTPGDELRVAGFPSNKTIWQQAIKRMPADYYAPASPSWSLNGDGVAFRWEPQNHLDLRRYVAVWRPATGIRYYKLQDAGDGNLNWLDESHIAWLQTDGIATLDLTSGQVTTTPYDKTLTSASG
jgi:hypothetical protein